MKLSSPRVDLLSCTILLHIPLPSITNVIATDSSKQTLLVPSYPYWMRNVLFNSRNTWLDSLNTLQHFCLFPFKIYHTYSYPVCRFVCIGTLFIYVSVYAMTLARLAKYVASTMSSLVSKLISLRMFSTIYIRKLIYGLTNTFKYVFTEQLVEETTAN